MRTVLIAIALSAAVAAQTGVPEGASGQLPAPPAVGTAAKTPPTDREIDLQLQLNAALEQRDQALIDLAAARLQLEAMVDVLSKKVSEPTIQAAADRWTKLETEIVTALGGDYAKGDRLDRVTRTLKKAPEKKD